MYDPWESWNRRVYHFNYRFDEWVLPVVRGYEYVTPHFVRSGVSNFFDNLGDVPNLLNNLAHGRARRRWKPPRGCCSTPPSVCSACGTLRPRWASHKRSEDFGQTGFYGGQRPLPVLPILGPSNLRDTGGLVVDYVGEYQVNYLNVPQTSGDHRRSPPCAWWTGANTSFRYGQMNSPFEYEKLRYIYTEARKLQIAE